MEAGLDLQSEIIHNSIKLKKRCTAVNSASETLNFPNEKLFTIYHLDTALFLQLIAYVQENLSTVLYNMDFDVE